MEKIKIKKESKTKVNHINGEVEKVSKAYVVNGKKKIPIPKGKEVRVRLYVDPLTGDVSEYISVE